MLHLDKVTSFSETGCVVSNEEELELEQNKAKFQAAL